MTNSIADKGSKKLPWELFVSEGEVSLSKLRVISKRGEFSEKASLLIGISFILWLAVTIAALFFSVASQFYSVRFSKSIVGLVSDTGSRPPKIRPFSVNTGRINPEQVAALTTTSEALGWIQQSIADLNKNRATPEYCNTTTKITDSWFVGDGTQPNCRVTKDNIYVWALIKNDGSEYSTVLPLAGVFHKDKLGWNFYVIEESRVQIPGYQSISMQSIPRTVWNDLPELQEKGD